MEHLDYRISPGLTRAWTILNWNLRHGHSLKFVPFMFISLVAHSLLMGDDKTKYSAGSLIHLQIFMCFGYLYPIGWYGNSGQVEHRYSWKSQATYPAGKRKYKGPCLRALVYNLQERNVLYFLNSYSRHLLFSIYKCICIINNTHLVIIIHWSTCNNS